MKSYTKLRYIAFLRFRVIGEKPQVGVKMTPLQQDEG